MRRIFQVLVISGLWLACLLFVWAMMPPKNLKEAGMRPNILPGRTVKFVFKGIDKQKNAAVLFPVIAPAFGVQLDSGPRMLQTHTIINCIPDARTVSILVDGQPASVTEILLACGEQTLVIKEIYFDPK
ncbi:MAG: hypothetical protein ACREBG_11825 [Pyrinomonadaceae bacterium]